MKVNSSGICVPGPVRKTIVISKPCIPLSFLVIDNNRTADPLSGTVSTSESYRSISAISYIFFQHDINDSSFRIGIILSRWIVYDLNAFHATGWNAVCGRQIGISAVDQD